MSEPLLPTFAALLAVLVCGAAVAHNPIVIDGGPTDASTAWDIEDISISQVAYHHAKPGQSELWLTFEGQANQSLDLELGVPKIERYAGLRPSVAVLGPGLPPAPELPFAVPAGLGAVVFPTDGQTPREFDEELTGTVDWLFEAESVTLPQDGTYYIVSYIPSGDEGKFLLSLGRTEQFGVSDILRIPQIVVDVRRFHEVFPWGGILGWGFLAVVLVLGFLLFRLV